jgi:uncharacterized membrane protein AbrB (regulator of aidB expression)
MKKIVTTTIDLGALIVSIMVGFLAMPIGAVLGAVMVGGGVFSITWKNLGNTTDSK